VKTTLRDSLKKTGNGTSPELLATITPPTPLQKAEKTRDKSSERESVPTHFSDRNSDTEKETSNMTAEQQSQQQQVAAFQAFMQQQQKPPSIEQLVAPAALQGLALMQKINGALDAYEASVEVPSFSEELLSVAAKTAIVAVVVGGVVVGTVAIVQAMAPTPL
jgi:hypothetical protein